MLGEGAVTSIATEDVDGHIQSGTDALITLSSSWGIGLTILFFIILAILILIGIYIWKVAPVRVGREIEELKAKINAVTLPKQAPTPVVDNTLKIKGIFAELDRIKARLDRVEGRCPQHQAMLNETLTSMKVINETLPQALESISSLNDKVWDIAMRGQPGAKP